VLLQSADQMKKARLIQPNLLAPALGDATCSSRLSKSISVLQHMGTIGVSRKPPAGPERGVILGAEETGAVDAITLKSENARNFIMGRPNSRCTDDLLVNCGQPPHILTTTPKIKIEVNRGDQDVALARWEDEGGSSILSPTSHKRQLPTSGVDEPVTEITPSLGTGIY